MASEPAGRLLRNNVSEALRLALHEPVTAVKDGRQIACIVSVAAFAEAGGDVERLGVAHWSDATRADHELGHGEPDVRVQRLCRLIVHAAHARAFAPLLVNGQAVAVVIPPLSADRAALPSGPWIRIDAELLA